MARPLRIEFEGALYHVTARGNAREAIAKDDADRNRFLAILGKTVSRFNWLCHAYCLMGNHYHLLIETPDGNLSQGMRHLNGVYTQAFNRRHKRVGHVLQGRFKAILVDKDSYLLELCRYIVLNPVRARMVKHPREYPWSSYRATTGLAKPPDLLTCDWLLNQFGKHRVTAQKRYRTFVLEGRDQPSPWEQLTGQVMLGPESFVKNMAHHLHRKADIREIPRKQRLAGRPPLKQLFSEKGAPTKVQRDRRIRRACLDHGYTLASIARHLNLHYTTVSKIVNARTAPGR